MANATRQVHHGNGKGDAIRLVVLLMLALSALGTSGCSVYLATHPPQYPDTSVIQEGKSSRPDVLSALGQPTTTSTSNSKVVDVFKLHNLEADEDRAWTFFMGDFATLGFYEVLATPEELLRRYIQRSTIDYVVTYGQDGRVESVKVIPE